METPHNKGLSANGGAGYRDIEQFVLYQFVSGSKGDLRQLAKFMRRSICNVKPFSQMSERDLQALCERMVSEMQSRAYGEAELLHTFDHIPRPKRYQVAIANYLELSFVEADREMKAFWTQFNPKP